MYTGLGRYDEAFRWLEESKAGNHRRYLCSLHLSFYLRKIPVLLS